MERIQDWTGKTIGWRETKPNGDIVIRDFYGTIRGKYDKYCGNQFGIRIHEVSDRPVGEYSKRLIDFCIFISVRYICRIYT